LYVFEKEGGDGWGINMVVLVGGGEFLKKGRGRRRASRGWKDVLDLSPSIEAM
jgi:hypothetical protein